MNHRVYIAIDKKKATSAGVNIVEHQDHYEISFEQDPMKHEAAITANSILTAGGYKQRNVEEFLDELVSFENALELLKLR